MKLKISLILMICIILSSFVCLSACNTNDEQNYDTSAPAIEETTEIEKSESLNTSTDCEESSDTDTETDTFDDIATATDTEGEEETTNQTEGTEVSSDFATEMTTEEPTSEEETTTNESTVEETTTEEITTEEPTTEEETTLPADPSQTPKAEMPRIDINTEGGADIVSKDEYIRATISVSRCEDKYIRENLTANIRARGNSTFGAPKKPYRIKFDKKQSMLGLNGERHMKNWVLMADYFDASMLRTYATFKFAQVLLGGKYYSSDCIPVEVYLNGNYHGVYLLCEQTQINPNRVNIYEKEDNETNLEIGYLMIGQGGRTDEPETIVIPVNVTVTDRTGAQMHFGALNFALSGSGYTEEQKAYVVKYCEGVFKVIGAALYENKYYTLSRDGTLSIKASFTGKTTAEKQMETIGAVFNIESAVALCALDEIVKNLDAMTFNMYVDLSPKGDGKLTLAAPWDFDFAMANTHYGTTHSSSGFYATNLSVSEGMRTNLFYVMLGSIDWFEEMVEELWQEKFEELKAVAEETLILSYKYMDAYNRDWERWGHPTSRWLISHHSQSDLATFKTHLDNGIFLHNWLCRRLEWLDRQWGNTVYPPSSVEDIVIDFTKEKSISLTDGWNRCSGEITMGGLLVRHTTGEDPYFNVNFGDLGEYILAEDYPYLEIKIKVPTSNSADSYFSEIFLCAGGVQHATGGISVTYTVDAKNTYVTYKLDLASSGFWYGEVHRVRLDIFSHCDPSDIVYVEYIKLTAN